MELRWVRRGFEVKAVSPAHLERRVSGFMSAVRARGGVVVAVERQPPAPRTQDHRAQVLFEVPLVESQPRGPEAARGPSVRKCELGAAAGRSSNEPPAAFRGSLLDGAL